MMNVQDGQRRAVMEWMSHNSLSQQIIDNVLMVSRPERPWDGFIHSSKLDWSKPAQSQVNNLLSQNLRMPVEVVRASDLGDLYHGALQTKFDKYWGTQGAYVEQKLEVLDIKFHGTVDRLQMGTCVGNILFEFKTVSSYERDKAGADKILNKLFKDKHAGDALTVSAAWNEFEKDIVARLRVRERKIQAKPEHLTQMFTYCWVLQQYYQTKIDYCVLVYSARDSYKTIDFSYYVPEHMDLVKRAYMNYCEVLECLHKMQQSQQQMNG